MSGLGSITVTTIESEAELFQVSKTVQLKTYKNDFFTSL